jgi:hypothetical protein
LPNGNIIAIDILRQMLTIAKTRVMLLDLAFRTVRTQINAPASPPGAPRPFALADLEAFKGSFCQAGFKALKTEIFQTTLEFDSPESYTQDYVSRLQFVFMQYLQTITMM